MKGIVFTLKYCALLIVCLVYNALVAQDERKLLNPIEAFNEIQSNIIEQDTVFFSMSDTFKVKTKYYCAFDSSVFVPEEYVIYKSFYTSNYLSDIKIFKNGKPIFNTTISKEFFKEYLNIEEIKYSILGRPFIKFKNRVIKISFSISIPLTDIGAGVNIKIDEFGSFKISDR